MEDNTKKSKIIFGINMSHDTACAAVVDGEVKVAIEEERLNGVKHCDGVSPFGRIIPFRSIQYCCDHLGITPQDVDLWCVNAVHLRALEFLKLQLIGIPEEKIVEVERPGHHLCHVNAAFYPSPYEEAAVLALDVNGGLSSSRDKKENFVIHHGKGTELKEVFKSYVHRGEISIPELYVIYAAILQLSPTTDGEYGDDDAHRSGGKLMGYSSHYHNQEMIENYGKLGGKDINIKTPEIAEEADNRYVIKIKKLIEYLNNSGKVDKVDPNVDYETLFGWHIKNHVTWNYRKTSLRDFENAMFAQEAQLMLEKYILKMATLAYELTGSKNLCVAGGPMLNIIACNRILKETPIENLFVQPAAHDGGNAIGAALWGYYSFLNGEERVYDKKVYNTCLGKKYTHDEVTHAIYDRKWNTSFNATKIENEDEQIERLTEILKDDGVICLFKGGSEFGPRALGNRSFIASPRHAKMLETMNAVKDREWYRPVAPLVLKESLHEYFDAPFDEAPYMTINAHCKEHAKELVPAITHIDGSARVQTVSEEYYPFITKLLRRFAEVTGYPPILINTSFNIGTPIVETPEEAITTFLNTTHQVKALMLEQYLIER